MLLILLRTLILYVVVVLSFKFMGKRQIGELQATELVVAILISNIASIPIEDTSVPLISGVIPILTLVCLEVIVSGISMVSHKFQKFLSGNPIVIIKNGKLLQHELWRMRFTPDDVVEELREQGIFDLREVEVAIVETDGKISVFKKSTEQALTPKLASVTVAEAFPQMPIVSNGNVMENEFTELGLDKKWLDKILKSENISVCDIFIMTSNKNKEYFIIPKQKNSHRKI